MTAQTSADLEQRLLKGASLMQPYEDERAFDPPKYRGYLQHWEKLLAEYERAYDAEQVSVRQVALKEMA